MYLKSIKEEIGVMGQLKNNFIFSFISFFKNLFVKLFSFIKSDHIFNSNSALSNRITSAIILFMIAILALIVGSVFINALFVISGLIMLLEWDRMFNKNSMFLKFKCSKFFIINVFVYSLSVLSVFLLNSYTIAMLILVFGFIYSMFTLVALNKDRFILEAIPSLYISGAVISSIYVYNRVGVLALILLFIITISTDTCAYFVGSYFKGPKLMPVISPGKTISGAVGGVIGAFIFSSLYLLILFLFGFSDVTSNLYLFGLLSIILSILAQCGDLFESYCKRLCDVKDSGNLIRGHGGLLDRFDSFIAIVAVYAVMVVLSMSLL